MSARRAVCLIRPQVHYRREAFLAGLTATGFDLRDSIADPRPGDALVIWNRHGANDALATRYEAAGASVLVAENGYIRVADANGWQSYAISRSQHHHGGAHRQADKSGAISGKPWRTAGDHILICAQRGFGSKVMQCPGWAERIHGELAVRTKRPVRFRKHPGNKPPEVPLERDLENCHAVVVWSSNAGIGALLAGVPVFYGAPRWIAEAAALPLAGADLEKPFLGDRTAGLANALANQWSIEEITAGLPFKVLL
jgi:hypothetical protein